MQKKSNLGSSVYLSQYSVKPGSQTDCRPKPKPIYKVQIVNQNLDQAIRDVRNHIRENPEWNLNVKKVSQHYKPKNQRPSIINETQQDQFTGNLLPQSSKQPPLSINFEFVRRPDFQKMKYTERQRQQYQNRIRQVKQKRMQFEVNLLQKQMRARLQRKIKQNLALKQKAQLIQEIQEGREERRRLRDRQSMKHQQQSSLLHQSNLANVDMLRRYKKRIKKRQTSESHSLSEQSTMQLKFRDFLANQQKQKVKHEMVERFRVLRTASQGSLRKKMGESRPIQTAQSSRRLNRGDRVQQ